MRCRICDRVLTEPNFNRDHNDYDPCDTCMAVVNDLLTTWTDKPYADEDMWADLPLPQSEIDPDVDFP